MKMKAQHSKSISNAPFIIEKGTSFLEL